MRRTIFSRNLILLLCFILASGCAATKTTTEPATTSTTPAASGEAAATKATEPATTSTTAKPFILYVTSDQVNLRECPSVKCKVAAVLKLGEEVIKLGQEELWIKVKVKASGREGWVASRLVGKMPKKKTSPRIKEGSSPRGKAKQGSSELQEEFSP